MGMHRHGETRASLRLAPLVSLTFPTSPGGPGSLSGGETLGWSLWPAGPQCVLLAPDSTVWVSVFHNSSLPRPSQFLGGIRLQPPDLLDQVNTVAMETTITVTSQWFLPLYWSQVSERWQCKDTTQSLQPSRLLSTGNAQA